MHQDFAREVLARFPRAETTPLLWQFVGDDASLHQLYDRHRGHTYHKKILFPLIAQLVRDALLEPDASGHKSFRQHLFSAPTAGKAQRSVPSVER